MAILINKDTRVLVQGITGKEGSRAARNMRDYGTTVVCGVTPGKGGQHVDDIPVYNSVAEALKEHPEINASVILVPPKFAKSAMLEAIDAHIALINVVTENIPIHDISFCISHAKEKGVRIVGPSSVGIISPGYGKMGSIGGNHNKAYSQGHIGVISKSGGMASETAHIFSLQGMGQSTVIGIGGDIINGFSFKEALELFEQDPDTHAVVLYGEIGGSYEETAAEFIKSGAFTKPVAAFVAGTFAASLPNVTLGHAGAIIEGGKGTREGKAAALKDAGVLVADVHHELVDLIKDALAK